MKSLRRFCALLLALLLALCVPVRADEVRVATLKENLTLLEAATLVCAMTEASGVQVLYDTLQLDDSNQVCTVQAGVFTLTLAADNGLYVNRATIAAAYLDADYALQMGQIFGMMLSTLSDLESLTALSYLDFNAFDTLKSNRQVLLLGDYTVAMSVDPESAAPYALSLSLSEPVPLATPAAAPAEAARTLLGRMDIDVSAAFLYDESTDLNGRLGQPGSYSSKINFARLAIAPNAAANASLSVEQGGSIEVFATSADAIARSADVQSKLPLVDSSEYHFVHGSALLRLSGSTTAEDAGRLITAFILAVDGASSPAQTSSFSAAATPAPQPTASPVPTLKAGDRVTFGAYEQDGSTANGQEPIEWIVLEVKDGEALLISLYALDVYNTYWGSPTWDRSTLRAWLNGEFANAAFSADERNAILLSTVTADKHPHYTSNPGADTQDKVFCLSYIEANTLMTAITRKCLATSYARNTRKVVTGGGYCYWWLRTPGKPGCGASIVATDGSYDYDASYDGFCYGVRPCIRMPADSPLLGR